MNEDRIIIAPTIWLPILLILLTLAVVAGVEWVGEDDPPTHTVADDCYSDLVVKQQTAQIGRYGTVWGLGENAPLTRGVMKSICEQAWSIDGPKYSPAPYVCGGVALQVPGGTPYPDPDCDYGPHPKPTASSTVQTPTATIPPCPSVIPSGLFCFSPTSTCAPWSMSLVCMPTPTPYHTLNCASPPQGFSACLFTPTPTAAALPETGGRP